ncbi:MAG: acetyl-CoA carboxylase carboxyltransferase subunit alpha [Lachnospiraceae bacterium]|jgi:acetyl-CoA carboxylase carboxyl transferase subunit alpha|nr:acetyl-CoA carboxylase carboxyltransferase subunit alpha [Lachnospiraceae bacterium]MEE3460968.1 acetyl-CoA carboxylase carboxyltransferase subunit alpha [Lachnospiraceae bacterium]
MEEAYESVKIARMAARPTTSEFIDKIFDYFIEFKGDRHFADDQSVIGGIATFDGIPVTVIGVEKGHTLEENMKHNFGCPNPEGYRKALRLMKQAEKFERPVITFISTAGAFCGIGAEERGQGEAIARNLMEMSRLKTPIISIFTGEGGSGGALGLAVADQVWMCEHALYSILSPEGFASILWKDPSRAAEAAALMKMNAKDLLQNGVCEKVFKEPAEGLENNLEFTTVQIKEALSETLPGLITEPKDKLLDNRYARFRKFGSYK